MQVRNAGGRRVCYARGSNQQRRERVSRLTEQEYHDVLYKSAIVLDGTGAGHSKYGRQEIQEVIDWLQYLLDNYPEEEDAGPTQD